MKTFLLFSSICLLMLGCGPSYKILSPQKEANFRLSDYTTFGFYTVEAKGDTISKTFETNVFRIKEAIKRNMESRGLTEAQEPALKINIGITVAEKTQTRQTNFQNDGHPLYMGQRRYSWKSKEVVVGKYREGTMLIDLIEATNNNMVWTGGGEGILPDKNSNFEKQINELVDKIFASIKQ